MNRIYLIYIIVILFGCGQEEPMPLVKGTRWASFNYKSVVTGSDVYQILYFESNTQVQRYSAEEKTAIIGIPDTFNYEYKHPRISIKVNGETYEGAVNSEFIRVFDRDYEKL